MPPSPKEAVPGPTVLLVDDDPFVRQMVAAILSREGFTVLSAQDGVDAIEQSRAFPGHIDLLLSDVLMPRMDGLALAVKVAAERPATRCLMISGHIPGDRLPSTVNFLAKPFTPTVLVAKVRQVLMPAMRASGCC